MKVQHKSMATVQSVHLINTSNDYPQTKLRILSDRVCLQAAVVSTQLLLLTSTRDIAITQVCWLVCLLVGYVRHDFSKTVSPIFMKLDIHDQHLRQISLLIFQRQGQSPRSKPPHRNLQIVTARPWFKISSPNSAFRQTLGYQKQRWSPRGRGLGLEDPRGQLMVSLALALKL